MIARPRLPTLAARDRRALRTGAWIVGPVLLVTLVLRPWATAALDARAEVARARTLLMRERALLAEAPRDSAVLLAASRALADESPRLFGGAEAVTASAELARYVTAQAAASGLVVQQTETQTPLGDNAMRDSAARVDSSAQRLRVAMRARGEIRAVVRFLRSMEDGPRLVRVERVGVSRGLAGTSETEVLTLTATITGLARSRFAGGAP